MTLLCLRGLTPTARLVSRTEETKNPRAAGTARGSALRFAGLAPTNRAGAGLFLARRLEQAVDGGIFHRADAVRGVDHQGLAAGGHPQDVVAEAKDLTHLRVAFQHAE